MEQHKKIIPVLILTVLIAVVVGINEKFSPVISDGNYLKRNEKGSGSYEEELELSVEGLFDSYEYQIKVPEQALTKREELEYIEAAWEEIEQGFPGMNGDVNCIRERVEIQGTYQEGMVQAKWDFDNYKIMDFEGNIIEEKIPKEGVIVQATVELNCGNSVICKDFYFRVFPRNLTKQEQLLESVQNFLVEQEQESGTEQFKLPEKIGEYHLVWQEKKTYLPLKILLLGAMIAGMIPWIEKSRRIEMQKKRNQELTIEYPDVVSKLSVLLSSGMTLQGAWKKIAFSYEKKRQSNEVKPMPAYEEMLIVCHELESGRGEEQAYTRFGERCGLARYRKLGNILAQNLRKGSRGIVKLLEKETETSFEERKQAAKRYGEEAVAKLIFPMLLMFGMILLILIIPAMAAFRI